MNVMGNPGAGNDNNYGGVDPQGRDVANPAGIGSEPTIGTGVGSDSNYGVGDAHDGATGTRAEDTNYGEEVADDDSRTIGEKIADVLTGGHPDEGLAPA
jgi:hypothetical protein